jgi:hypothetical protein
VAHTRYGPRCIVKNKNSYGSYNLAAKVARKEGKEGIPYRCNVCGWYHTSSMTGQEASRHKAKRNWEMWQLRQERDERIQLPRAG